MSDPDVTSAAAEPASRYARELNLDDLNAHSFGILLTPPGSQVLDVGTADGHPVAEALVARGCSVWGIELDETAAERARQFCRQIVVGDVEKLDLEQEFGDVRFDVILCLDVLEHLVAPDDALAKLTPLLAPNGVIVASIPNVTHAAVRLQLLDGRFTYTETGLLDRTHVRFFDRAEVAALFERAGLTVLDNLAVLREPHETEIPVDLDTVDADVLAGIKADPDAKVFQWIVVARPHLDTQADPTGLLTRLFDKVRELDGAARQSAEYVSWLEENLRARSNTDELNATLERTLRERVEELVHAHEELRALRADAAVKDAYLAEVLAQSGLDAPLPAASPSSPMPASYQLAAPLHAMVDRAVARLVRHPRLYKTLKRAGRRFRR
jgi:2-polyprenyl-3-methyl-5-hydroxy-6-metoxy-1,4-benzoquinol methylase